MRTPEDVMALFNDEDSFMHSSPREKFYEILFTANNDVVRYELDKILEKMAILEEMVVEQSGIEDVDQKIQEYKYSNLETVQSHLESLYVHKMGAIVSQSE